MLCVCISSSCLAHRFPIFTSYVWGRLGTTRATRTLDATLDVLSVRVRIYQAPLVVYTYPNPKVSDSQETAKHVPYRIL